MKDYERGNYHHRDFVNWIIKLLNEVYVKLDIDPVSLEELKEDYKSWNEHT